jgi:hypothetical protein
VTPRWYAAAGPAYLAALLAVDTQLGYGGQLGLGALTWLVLLAALGPLAPLARAQALGVVVFATVGEVTGSLIWGVYHYRLHNLPLFIPPAHGLVYLSGLALARWASARWLVAAAAAGSIGWGIAGLTVLPRLDVAGAFGVPLLCAFLWRSRARATYAAVFLVVAALELYGTSIGTWRWARTLPGLGIPDGNPPSGVASGYVWFDVMAMLVAPVLVAAVRHMSAAGRDAEPEAGDALLRLPAQLDATDRSDRDHERVGILVVAALHVDRDHPEAGLGLDPVEHEPRSVGELDLDDGGLNAGRLGERADRAVQALDERLVRSLRNRGPELRH